MLSSLQESVGCLETALSLKEPSSYEVSSICVNSQQVLLQYLPRRALERGEPRPASWELHQGTQPVVVAPHYLLCCVAVSCPGGRVCVAAGKLAVCLWSRLYTHIRMYPMFHPHPNVSCVLLIIMIMRGSSL